GDLRRAKQKVDNANTTGASPEERRRLQTDYRLKQAAVQQADDLFDRTRKQSKDFTDAAARYKLDYENSRAKLTEAKVKLAEKKEARRQLDLKSTIQEVRVTADGKPVFVQRFSVPRASSIQEMEALRQSIGGKLKALEEKRKEAENNLVTFQK